MIPVEFLVYLLHSQMSPVKHCEFLPPFSSVLQELSTIKILLYAFQQVSTGLLFLDQGINC